MDLKIFSLASMQAAIATTVFVKCPEVEYIKNTDIASWIKHIEKQMAEVKDEETAVKYEHCKALLKLASETDITSELFGVYNVPVRTGNEIMFIIQFEGTSKRDEFMKELVKLDAELSAE